MSNRTAHRRTIPPRLRSETFAAASTQGSSASAPPSQKHDAQVEKGQRPEHGKMRVLICDDHTLFREGIKAILEADDAIEIVGEAADGRQAVDMALSLHPEVVLMDVSMPNMIGYEAIRLIKHRDKRIRVLVLTMYEEEEVIALCLSAGASGYILKDAPATQLLEALRIVNTGGSYLSPQAARKVVEHFASGAPAPETKYQTLSNREREVLKLLADGLVVKEIASALNLSVKTVEAHKYNLMRKLDLHNRTELVKYALHKKLIEFPAIT
jgi:two-component system, NarL family, response regulator NreC